MNKAKETLSVCIPVYNMAQTVKDAIASVLNQTYKNFELIIVDNASTDGTTELIRSIRDKRIRFFVNKTNIGAQKNLYECIRRMKTDIIVTMAADDVLEKNALMKIYQVFAEDHDIAVTNRSYFHFDYDIKKPIRVMHRFDKDEIITIRTNYKKLTKAIDCSCQVSGMAFRRKFLKKSYFDQKTKPFVSIPTIYLSILKSHKTAIIKDDIVACRTTNNTMVKGGAHNPIFNYSPSASWHNMIRRILPEKKYQPFREYFDRYFIGSNYIGLVQIKNFGGFKQLIKEIQYMIKVRGDNVVNPVFWFFVLGCIITPRFILIPLVNWYKSRINSKFIEKRKFEYDVTLRHSREGGNPV